MGGVVIYSLGNGMKMNDSVEKKQKKKYVVLFRVFIMIRVVVMYTL